MRHHVTLLATGLIGALAVAAPGVAHHPDGHPQGKHGSDQTVVEECDGGTVTYDGPETMWPPNHKYRDLTVTAEADDPNDEVALATEGTHDEFADPDNRTGEMNGAGNTDDDIDPAMDADQGTGSAQTQHAIRAERSGKGDGRAYTITYEAQFGMGEPCVGAFDIEVPHSQGRSADNKFVHEP